MFLSGTFLPVSSSSNHRVQATQPPTISVQKPSLGLLLGKLPKEVGANIFADTASSGAKVDVAGIDLASTSAEDLLDALLKKLPKATVWVKVYLPKMDSKRITGDSLAAYVFAQSNLVGKVGEIKKGFTEILGQQVPDEQAAEFVKTLSLSPYYVIFRPGYVDRTEELSGAEREALIERLMSRPDLRGKYAAEHGKIMGEVIKRLVKDKVPAAP
jgi:hypothetical protein